MVLSGGFWIYLILYPFIAISTLYGGLGPGLLAIGLSCLATFLFWVQPVGGLAVASRADLVSMTVFILGNVLVAWICERLRRVSRQTARQAQILKESEQRLSLAQRARSSGWQGRRRR